MPITSYSDILDGPGLYEGQLVSTEGAIIRTGFNADSSILVFGRALVKGTGDKDLLLPVDANSVFQGIALACNSFEKRDGLSLNADGDMGYPLKYPVNLLIRGVVAVKVQQDVTPTSNVFWIHTPSGSERKGQFRANANTDKAVQLPGARFLRSASAGTIVPLAINLT